MYVENLTMTANGTYLYLHCTISIMGDHYFSNLYLNDSSDCQS